MIIDPQGNEVLDCGASEGIFTAEIDYETLRSWRSAFPVLRDRQE